MKTKIIPVVLALIAGFMTCFFSFYNRVTAREFVKALALAVLIFLALGFVLRVVLELNFPPEKPEGEELEGEAAEDTGEAEKMEEGSSRQGSVEVTEAEEDDVWQ